MNVISVYINPADGQVVQVLASDGIGAPTQGVMLVARFDAVAYPYEYAAINSSSKYIHFVDGTLVLDTHPVYVRQVIADEAWILARKAEVEAAEAEKTDDNDARAHILQQSAAALIQIENDLTAITNGKTAATAATTLAHFRTIILGMLDVMEHTCNRQEGEIKVLRAMLRSGLTDT